MSNIDKKKINALFLTIVLLSGFIGLTFPLSASAELYQNTICNNTNLNFNDIGQEDTQTISNGQQESAVDVLNHGDSEGPLLTMDDILTGANNNIEPFLNSDGNIVNICFNNNDNEQDVELIGTQKQIEQPTPTPSADYLDLAVANVDSDNVSILLGDGTGSFSTPNNFDTGDAPISVAVGDFNDDGELDLAVANIISDSVSILLGNGDGTFDAANNFPAGNSPYSVTVGDFNSNGVLDLVTANEAASSNDVSILLGNGDGTFGTATNFPAGGTTPRSVAVGDFNDDGELDLAVANTGSDDISILLGNGDGTFGTANTFATGEESFPSFIAVSDLDNNNVLDLVTTYANTGEPNSNSISILSGNGDGTFGEPSYYKVGTSPISVAVGDFNDDGELDLAVANSGTATSVSILLGNGDGTFGTATSFGGGPSPRSIATGDFNKDSKLDLVTSNEFSGFYGVSILLGNGDGTFGTATSFAAGDRPVSVAVGNFN